MVSSVRLVKGLLLAVPTAIGWLVLPTGLFVVLAGFAVLVLFLREIIGAIESWTGGGHNVTDDGAPEWIERKSPLDPEKAYEPIDPSVSPYAEGSTRDHPQGRDDDTDEQSTPDSDTASESDTDAEPPTEDRKAPEQQWIQRRTDDARERSHVLEGESERYQ